MSINYQQTLECFQIVPLLKVATVKEQLEYPCVYKERILQKFTRAQRGDEATEVKEGVEIAPQTPKAIMIVRKISRYLVRC